MADILLVDDSAAIRNEVGDFLRKNQFNVVTANDGLEGLVKVKADPKIRLIISDINMPGMDGLTMIEKIRSELNNTSVKVIMLTTSSDPMLKARGKAAGVKGWIVKPFNGPSSIEVIKKLVWG